MYSFSLLSDLITSELVTLVMVVAVVAIVAKELEVGLVTKIGSVFIFVDVRLKNSSTSCSYFIILKINFYNQ